MLLPQIGNSRAPHCEVPGLHFRETLPKGPLGWHNAHMSASSQNVERIRYKVGIDVGLRSIGFCAVQVDADDRPIKLLKTVVHVHDAGVSSADAKKADTRKLVSGVARRTRRLYRARKRRLVDLDRHLEGLGWPLVDPARFADPHEPWFARERLVSGRVGDANERMELLSVALRHIAHHRGWRNPYSTVESLQTDAPPSEFLQGLNQRVSEKLGMELDPGLTQGQLVAKLLHCFPNAKIRGPEGILSGKLHQSDNAGELRLICRTQGLDRHMTEELVRLVFQAKSPKANKEMRKRIGRDRLPGQEAHIRAEKAHPVFQRFRIVAVLANLRIRETHVDRRLTAEEMRTLTDFLLGLAGSEQPTWEELAENLNIERHQLRGTAKASVDGAPVLRFPPIDATTDRIYASKLKWLAEWWRQADEERRGYMVDALSNSGGSEDEPYLDDEIAEMLEQASEKDQAKLDGLHLPGGRASYCLDTLRRLTDAMLGGGLDLFEARKAVFPIDDDWAPPTDPIGAPVGNPPVDRVLKHVARWLKAATGRWGAPQAVNIEHVREGLGSEKAARELTRMNDQRRRNNQKLVEEMGEKLGMSGRIRRSDRMRYEAIRRQNCECLYCGRPITYQTMEMDHIVPRAGVASTNTRSNLAAVCRRCNQQKDKLPFAVWAESRDSPKEVSLEGAVQRVRHWLRDAGMGEKELRTLRIQVIARLKSKLPDEEFDGRSMESVAWMANELRARVEAQYRGSGTTVRVYRGALTAEARKASGFEGRVNLIGGRGKDRFDRRHHAMDALVIALMNQSVAQTLALRLNMRDSQWLTQSEQTWRQFHGAPGEAERKWEAWERDMRDASDLFNLALDGGRIPITENVRLRVGNGRVHEDGVIRFKPEYMVKGKGAKGGGVRLLGDSLPSELIDRAETPALWTALTRLPEYDQKSGLPENPDRVIRVNGTVVQAVDRIRFFGTPASVAVRGGYAKLGKSIHHARIYRINGKTPKYAMIRVYTIDLMRFNHEDIFTVDLKPSTISMRCAEKKLKQAIGEGNAEQIGWLVEGDQLELDTAAYTKGVGADLMREYPMATCWRVAGFPDEAKLGLRPVLLAEEGLREDASKSVREVLENKGWRPAVNALLSPGSVRVVRRNVLGEPRFKSSGHLPTTIDLV